MSPRVSVVVPSYNRRDQLRGLFEGLARQTLGSRAFEVILVSDGSTDGTPEEARRLGRELALDVRVLEVEHGGPPQARNAGARVARGAVLAFTDDDVRVSPGWLEAGLEGFRDAAVGGVEGRTEPELGEESIYRFNVDNREGGQYPTCNIFYRKEAFDRVGGFDERFRRAREDSDLAFRVLDAGYTIPFCPRALAAHRSHHRSVTVPLFIASTLPDSVLLWSKHPGRDRLRPRFYVSDAVKVALGVIAAGLPVAGRPGWAAAAALAFLLLVLRSIVAQVLLARVARPDRLLALLAVYAAAPFWNLYYLLLGTFRVRRGLAPTRPV